MLVDSHCHLADPRFEGELDETIERAGLAGVVRMVAISTRGSDLKRNVEIAERFDQVYFAAGVHPHHAAAEPPATVGALLDIAKHPKLAAIGETGLDYHYTKDSADQQKASFRTHIEAARRSGLPLVVHARAADQDMSRILTEEHRRGPFGCVMHCYASGRQLAERAIELGFYLSMSGIATFPNSGPLREIFSSAPVERTLVETDAPYLAPAPYRGKRNEPSYVARTAAVGAELFGMTPTEFALQTTRNFNRIFTKAAVPGVKR